MTVKNLLPIIGVGSAAALVGLVASRRSVARNANADHGTGARARPSGIVARSGGALDAEQSAGAPLVPEEFWNAPEPSSRFDEAAFANTPSVALIEEDGDDLGADWLARATATDDAALYTDGDDDPAEVAADSLSMISDASRYAATSPSDDADPNSERL